MMETLYTIGYESSSLDDFIATLLAAKVSKLIDVRDFPGSRRKGFSKTALSIALNEVDIEYIHLKGLGDPKEGRDASRAGEFGKFEKIYLKHMQTSQAKTDLERAVTISQQGNACLMCYERSHQHCHRKYVAESISSIIDLNTTHLGVREGLALNATKIRERKNTRTRQSAPTSR